MGAAQSHVKHRAGGIGSLLIGVLLLLSGQPVWANLAEQPPSQRMQFMAAKTALEQRNSERFAALAADLQDYPLYPYLTFWRLQQDLAKLSSEDVQAFINEHADTPLASRLQGAWLRHLAAQRRWPEYLQYYQESGNAELRCHLHTAQLETGREAEAWAGAESLWMVGFSQHKACDRLFAAWDKAGKLSTEHRWQRIELVMAQGNPSLARYLSRGLPEADRQLVDRWRQLHERPQLLGDDKLLQPDNERHRHIALHTIRRLASADPEAAAELWPMLAFRHEFDEVQRHAAAHAIALHLALQGNVRALEWYATLPAESFNESSRGWAIRAALRNQRWLAVATWIEEMPAQERGSEMWSYWLARAYEALGKQEQAEALYRTVSARRGYYGFLAADRIGVDYNLTHQALRIENESLEQVANHPALVRAYELYQLDQVLDSRREWEFALARMDQQERVAAGKLAARWEWHDRALLALARANHFDDLAIRFPLAYSETFFSEAERQALDPSWIYAVARQESAMDPLAHSPVGALGLMQLMPATGRSIARQLATDISNRLTLLQPELNIRFGSHYLREMLERFDNPVLATAAYNAGPHRVQRWFPEQAGIEADIWVDTIPFHETRLYVRRVMAYSVFYDQRLERPVVRLSQRMPPVGSPQALAAAKLTDIE